MILAFSFKNSEFSLGVPPWQAQEKGFFPLYGYRGSLDYISFLHFEKEVKKVTVDRQLNFMRFPWH